MSLSLSSALTKVICRSVTLAVFVALPLFAQGSEPDQSNVGAGNNASVGAVNNPDNGSGGGSNNPPNGETQNTPPSGGGAKQEGGGSSFLFMMVAMIAIIYFVMIRPEQKRQKARQKMLSALKKGDRILTVGGVIGVIATVKDSSYLIKTGEGTVIEFSKASVQNVLVGDDVEKAAEGAK
jgi:preprotein translocase subunit YajC